MPIVYSDWAIIETPLLRIGKRVASAIGFG
jgi:hypothetical protein